MDRISRRRSRTLTAISRLATYLPLAVGLWISREWLAPAYPNAVPRPPTVDIIQPSNERRAEAVQSYRPDETANAVGIPQSRPAPWAAAAAPAIRQSRVPNAKPLPFATRGHAGRKALILDIQRGLARSGCYRGAMTGLWGADTKRALSAFLLAANARLPIDRPDDILLHLVDGHEHVNCGEKRPIGWQRDAPSDGLPSVRPSKSSNRRGWHGARRKQSRPLLFGQRSERDLLTHPLGRF